MDSNKSTQLPDMPQPFSTPPNSRSATPDPFDEALEERSWMKGKEKRNKREFHSNRSKQDSSPGSSERAPPPPPPCSQGGHSSDPSMPVLDVNEMACSLTVDPGEVSTADQMAAGVESLTLGDEQAPCRLSHANMRNTVAPGRTDAGHHCGSWSAPPINPAGNAGESAVERAGADIYATEHQPRRDDANNKIEASQAEGEGIGRANSQNRAGCVQATAVSTQTATNAVISSSPTMDIETSKVDGLDTHGSGANSAPAAASETRYASHEWHNFRYLFDYEGSVKSPAEVASGPNDSESRRIDATELEGADFQLDLFGPIVPARDDSNGEDHDCSATAAPVEASSSSTEDCNMVEHCDSPATTVEDRPDQVDLAMVFQPLYSVTAVSPESYEAMSLSMLDNPGSPPGLLQDDAVDPDDPRITTHVDMGDILGPCQRADNPGSPSDTAATIDTSRLTPLEMFDVEAYAGSSPDLQGSNGGGGDVAGMATPGPSAISGMQPSAVRTNAGNRCGNGCVSRIDSFDFLKGVPSVCTGSSNSTTEAADGPNDWEGPRINASELLNADIPYDLFGPIVPARDNSNRGNGGDWPTARPGHAFTKRIAIAG